MSFGSVRAFGANINRVMQGEHLSRREARDMFTQVMMNTQPDLQQGAFLAALTAKGETAEEIAGSWQAIYELDTVKVVPDVEGDLVENCGTGMDSLKTFNISTAASIIATAAGVKMAKHGARAITSVCGTIDILEQLGIDVECDPAIVKHSIEEAGIGIFNGMSPLVHPQALGRILSQISFGTTLNIAASLANPAMPRCGVRGVYSKDLVVPVAEVMREIGYKRALVVHGQDSQGQVGMDEASTIGDTFVAELDETGTITTYSFCPEEVGITPAEKNDLAPLQDKEAEAIRMLAVLGGKEQGPRLDIVSLNAALIIYLMRITPTIKEGIDRAKEIVNEREAIIKLRSWVEHQNSDIAAGMQKFDHLLKKTIN